MQWHEYQRATLDAGLLQEPALVQVLGTKITHFHCVTHATIFPLGNQEAMS